MDYYFFKSGQREKPAAKPAWQAKPLRLVHRTYRVVERAKALDLLASIRDFFMRSRDFNGICLLELQARAGLSEPELRSAIATLLQAGQVSLAFASHSINPHIKRLPDLPVDQQIARLWSEGIGSICVYPTAEVIRSSGLDLSQWIAIDHSQGA